MAFDFGLNFRLTSGFVTDGTNESYVLASDTYPTTRGGLTFGWDSAVSSRDRSAVIDRRLAGIHFVAGNAGRTFRIDLTASGSVSVHIAYGDHSGGNNNQKWQIYDNVTQLSTHGPTNVSAANYLDASGTNRTEAAWPAGETAESLTFSSTTFFIKPNSGTADSQTLAHLRVVQAASGGSTIVFRKTLSQIGTGVGKRQSQ
jgi:hypothetical protein